MCLTTSIISPRTRGAAQRALGAGGELAAANYLRQRGYRILATNVRLPMHAHGGEIDILAMDGDVLCFVEVKSRRTRHSDPSEAVGSSKRKQLIALADAYLSLNESPPDLLCRFDVVSVVFGAGTRCPTRVELVKNAFWPE